MTKLSTTLVQSGITLIAGAALIAVPMFAAAHGNTGDASPANDGSVRTVAISDNGSVLVRGAKITDISGSVVTARTTWDNLTLTWTVDTDSDTDMVRDDGSDANVSDMSTGDYVSFSGALDTDQSNFTVKADTVRDWSIEGDKTETRAKPASMSFWQNISAHFPAFGFFGHAGMHK